MEIVLQWFDEIDDLVFAGFSFWRRLRHFSLLVGLTAALGLYALHWLGIAGQSALALLDIAVLALAVWMLAAALSVATRLGRRTPAGNA
jgi:hypothetical protein